MLMLYLYVLQNQWIVIALLCGTALVLAMALTYHAMWLPRGVEKKSGRLRVRGPVSFLAWLRTFMPMVIILLFVACIAFTIYEVFENYSIPPNW